MHYIRIMLTAVAAGSFVPAACGGKLLEDADATSDAMSDTMSDAPLDVPYDGEWCNWLYGPDGGDGGGWVFCGVSPYVDAWTHCHFIPNSGGPPSGPWGCCTDDNFLCCPGAVDMWKYGDLPECCESVQSCSRCCDGIGPGPAYTK